MDAIGLLLSATLVVAVVATFELVVRAVCEAVDDVRYSVTPAVLGGLRAWGDDDRDPRPGAGRLPDADDAPPPGGPMREPSSTPGDAGGLVIPVTAVTRLRTHCAAG